MRPSTRRRATSSVLVLLLLTLSLGALPSSRVPASAAAPSPPAFGVVAHIVEDRYDWNERIDVLNKLQAAGVKWIRIGFHWRTLEFPNNTYNNYHVAKLDRITCEATRRGIRVLGMVYATPEWANGGLGPEIPPSDVSNYADFATWAADRYKSEPDATSSCETSGVRGLVSAWEVWNEPNLPWFWDGTKDKYSRLVRAAYSWNGDGFKVGNPTAPVVLGGVTCLHKPAFDWLTSLYNQLAQLDGYTTTNHFFDVMNVHPYMAPGDRPPEEPAPDWDANPTKCTMDAVKRIDALMSDRSDGAKPIWFTEFGWSSHANDGTESPQEIGVSQSKQADFLIRTLEFLRDYHPYVKRVFWYNDRNEDQTPSASNPRGYIYENNFGLFCRNWQPNGEPVEKLVYQRLRNYFSDPDVPESLHTCPEEERI